MPQDLGCDIVLDMATLTGAQGISTGKYHAMHLTNQHSWEAAVSEAGRMSGDLSFPGVRGKQHYEDVIYKPVLFSIPRFTVPSFSTPNSARVWRT